MTVIVISFSQSSRPKPYGLITVATLKSNVGGGSSLKAQCYDPVNEHIYLVWDGGSAGVHPKIVRINNDGSGETNARTARLKGATSMEAT